MRATRPFPYASLPTWRRDAAALGRRVLRHLRPADPRTPVDALGPRWHRLLGGPLAAVPRAPAVVSRAELRERYAGATLGAVLRHPTLGVVAVLLDRPFGLTLAARALGVGEEGARRSGAAGGLTGAGEGALAVLASRCAALACAPSPPPVLRGVTDALDDVLDALPGRAAELVAWPWRVALGGDAGEVVLLVAAAALLGVAEPGALPCGRTREIEVAFAVVAGRTRMAPGEVASLAVGDALVLDSVGMSNGVLTGEVTLALGGVALPARIEGAAAVRIAGAAAVPGRLDMNGADEEGVAAVRTEVLATLEVEVVVEVARGSATVEEVAAWRVGEVVTLGQRLGEVVGVRAGGRLVARGELVDVDGEVGVRLTELV